MPPTKSDSFDKPVDPAFTDGWDDVPIVEGDSFGETVTLEAGQVYVGRFVGTDPNVETDNGVVAAHRFLSAYGMKETVWGGHDLDPKLAEVAKGQTVRIEYVKSIDIRGGKTLKLFKVQVR